MLNYFQLHETAILWLTGLSLVTFVGTLIIVPLLVVRIPADYFANDKPHRTPWAVHHPFVRGALLFSKNLAGYVLILAGILMLLLPGQGLLTILIGIMLLDFPGKFRLQKWLLTRRTVLKSVNWLRKRAKRTPLNLEGLVKTEN
jgi:uncharacterized membrane protein SpoIIM required for sporulation